jgi:hypothetical protein
MGKKLDLLSFQLACHPFRVSAIHLNVDKFGAPDLRFDLETFPYPWDDNSVAQIEMHHVLEHLGQQTEIYLKIIQELYRICQPGAKLHITVPHHRSDRFFHDPTHVRVIACYFMIAINCLWGAIQGLFREDLEASSFHLLIAATAIF